jgi:hypothetical protein
MRFLDKTVPLEVAARLTFKAFGAEAFEKQSEHQKRLVDGGVGLEPIATNCSVLHCIGEQTRPCA